MMDVDSEEPVRAERVSGVAYTPTYQRFIVKKHNFEQQYSHMYQKRLRQMRPWLLESAKRKWRQTENKSTSKKSAIRYVNKIVEMGRIPRGKTSVIVGTIYKQMNKKPNILRDLEAEAKFSYNAGDGDNEEPKSNANESYASEDDTLILEDESGRIDLVATTETLDVHAFVTGVVIAVKGFKREDGSFQVDEICLPDFCPTKKASSSDGASKDSVKEDAFVLLVSGLNVGSSEGAHLPHLLAEYVTGHLGDASKVSSRIARVVLAGNCADMRDEENTELPQKRRSDVLKFGKPLQQLDLVLSQLLASVPVDLMPGERDASNLLLPQQPLHPCLLPHAGRFSSLRSVSNPYTCEIGSVRFVGCAGQNIDDVLRCTLRKSVRSAVDVCERLVQWGQIAPTAPDTLACYPFMMRDPFVLGKEETPGVFFAGNCERFETKLIERPNGSKTRIVCLPAFNRTGVAALVNLRDLSCVPLSLGFS